MTLDYGKFSNGILVSFVHVLHNNYSLRMTVIAIVKSRQKKYSETSETRTFIIWEVGAGKLV